MDLHLKVFLLYPFVLIEQQPRGDAMCTEGFGFVSLGDTIGHNLHFAYYLSVPCLSTSYRLRYIHPF